jgi:outer membrane protein assembly factor BamA
VLIFILLRHFLISVILIVTGAGYSYGQNHLLVLKPLHDHEASVLEKISNGASLSMKLPNRAASDKELKKLMSSFYEEGYLSASLDSLLHDSASTTAIVFVGEKYKLAKLNPGNVPRHILSEVGYRDKLYRNKVLNPAQIRRLQERIITYSGNNGFPFASIRLDSLIFDGGTLRADLNYNPGERVIVDSLSIRGTATIAPVYIRNYLNIKSGDLYNESLIKNISTRMQELPFAGETRTPHIYFIENKARITLYLEDKKASQFDGILGILTDQVTAKTTITGDVRLKLHNVIGRGEVLDINWKSPGHNTQDLRTRLVYPFLFDTPLGLDAALAIYKRDTTYLNVDRNLGVQYILAGGSYVKVFVRHKTSSLLSTSGFENITVLPDFADVSSTVYGVGNRLEKLDYRLNPRRGYTIESSVAAGNKKITPNRAVNPEVYKDIPLAARHYTGELTAGIFHPIASRGVIHIGSHTGLINSTVLFQNELLRIGGLRSLRGFDEESILASFYQIVNLEYRYLLEQNSHLFLFTNGAYYENTAGNKSVFDRPVGFGAGISFETKLGIFTLVYAVGRQFDNPIEFRSAKIHFGLINYF